MLGRRPRPSEIVTASLPLGATTGAVLLSLDSSEAFEARDRFEGLGFDSCERVRGVWGGVACCTGAKSPCVSFSVSPVNCEVEGVREEALGVGLGSILGWVGDSCSFSRGSDTSEVVTGAGEGLTVDEDFREGIRESRTWPK